MSPSQSDKPNFGEHPKVTAFHLQRWAYIYVRQSSLKQVQQNQESQMYQYRLQQRALELGWAKDRIRVIDSDLGYSGQDAEQRDWATVLDGLLENYAEVMVRKRPYRTPKQKSYKRQSATT